MKENGDSFQLNIYTHMGDELFLKKTEYRTYIFSINDTELNNYLIELSEKETDEKKQFN